MRSCMRWHLALDRWRAVAAMTIDLAHGLGQLFYPLSLKGSLARLMKWCPRCGHGMFLLHHLVEIFLRFCHGFEAILPLSHFCLFFGVRFGLFLLLEPFFQSVERLFRRRLREVLGAIMAGFHLHREVWKHIRQLLPPMNPSFEQAPGMLHRGSGFTQGRGNVVLWTNAALEHHQRSMLLIFRQRCGQRIPFIALATWSTGLREVSRCRCRCSLRHLLHLMFKLIFFPFFHASGWVISSTLRVDDGFGFFLDLQLIRFLINLIRFISVFANVEEKGGSLILGPSPSQAVPGHSRRSMRSVQGTGGRSLRDFKQPHAAPERRHGLRRA
mmetsp:Transcript_67743/g.148673  ORF Transcript_67743/g.148673 Transcript_67743/m.148673 type:complete len:327 (+) Transcript_67743:334-1314(+)